MGLLAWSPEPGEDGLLLFPGEQDDVTEHKERQKQGGINEAGSGDLVTFRHVSPKGSHPLPNSTPPTHLPTSYWQHQHPAPEGPSSYTLLLGPGEWHGWFHKSKACQTQEGWMPKPSHSKGTPRAGYIQPGTQGQNEKENQKLQEGREEERRKNARRGKGKLRAQVKMASFSGAPISTWYVVFRKEHGRSPGHPLKNSVARGNLPHFPAIPL